MSGIGDTAIKVWAGLSDRRGPADRERAERVVAETSRRPSTGRRSVPPGRSAAREPVVLSKVSDVNARSLIALREALDRGLSLRDAVKAANERVREVEDEMSFR